MNYLEQVFFDGKAIKEGFFKVGDKEVSYKISNLTYEHQLEVDKILASMGEDVSNLQVSHTYIGEVLARTLIECNDYTFDSVEECKKFLADRPAILVETFGKIQGDFEKEIRALLESDTINEAFSKTPSTEQVSKQE